MTTIRLRGLILVTGTLALAATAAPAAAYMQWQMKKALVTSYSYPGTSSDDLPAPPIAAPSPNAQAALPKLGEYAVKGKVFKAVPQPTRGAALRR